MKKFKISKSVILLLALTLIGAIVVIILKHQIPYQKVEINAISEPQIYYNGKYEFSFKYPSSWAVEYYGSTPELSRGLALAPSEDYLISGDGGIVKGAKLEVFIHDIKELDEADPNFPNIDSIGDWMDWGRKNLGLSLPSSYEEEYIIVSNQNAVKEVYMNDPAGEMIRITVLTPNKNYAIQMQYIGSEPDFSENLKTFEAIIQTFSF